MARLQSSMARMKDTAYLLPPKQVTETLVQPPDVVGEPAASPMIQSRPQPRESSSEAIGSPEYQDILGKLRYPDWCHEPVISYDSSGIENGQPMDFILFPRSRSPSRHRQSGFEMEESDIPGAPDRCSCAPLFNDAFLDEDDSMQYNDHAIYWPLMPYPSTDGNSIHSAVAEVDDRTRATEAKQSQNAKNGDFGHTAKSGVVQAAACDTELVTIRKQRYQDTREGLSGTPAKSYRELRKQHRDNSTSSTRRCPRRS